jgi:hypothetical protein
VDSLPGEHEHAVTSLKAANVGIWMIAAEDRTIYVNKKMTEIRIKSGKILAR